MAKRIRSETAVIANGQTESSVVDLRGVSAVTIYAQSTLIETVTVRASYDRVDAFDLESDGATIVLVAGQAKVLTRIPFSFMSFEAGAGVAAERSFVVEQEIES